MYFRENEYLESSGNEIVCLVLTSVDLKLFLEQYNVYDLHYVSGWKFKSLTGMFKDYIDKWITIKNKATLEGNEGLRTLAKLMLNALYGKFGTRLDVRSKIPYLGDDDIIHYTYSDVEEKDGIYIPVASFVTAWARDKTIRTSQAIKTYSIEKYGIDKYLYSDTDSVHTTLAIEELEKFCQIDKVKLGYWKNEGFATRGKFIRQKCYIEEIEGKVKITCAGMPSRCYDYVNFSNFKEGMHYPGNLKQRNVKGGIKLIESDFTIKEEKFKTFLDKRS